MSYDFILAAVEGELSNRIWEEIETQSVCITEQAEGRRTTRRSSIARHCVRGGGWQEGPIEEHQRTEQELFCFMNVASTGPADIVHSLFLGLCFINFNEFQGVECTNRPISSRCEQFQIRPGSSHRSSREPANQSFLGL